MFCIDTCHIWTVGYDISTVCGVKKFFNDFEKYIGINKISCIHFNNSLSHLGSRLDRHGDIAYGMINIKGLSAFAKFCNKNKIPLITETPLLMTNRKQELKLLKSFL